MTISQSRTGSRVDRSTRGSAPSDIHTPAPLFRYTCRKDGRVAKCRRGCFPRWELHTRFIGGFTKFIKWIIHRPCSIISRRSSTYCLLLLIKILSRRFYGGVDFLKLINRYIVSDEVGTSQGHMIVHYTYPNRFSAATDNPFRSLCMDCSRARKVELKRV